MLDKIIVKKHQPKILDNPYWIIGKGKIQCKINNKNVIAFIQMNKKGYPECKSTKKTSTQANKRKRKIIS